MKIKLYLYLLLFASFSCNKDKTESTQPLILNKESSFELEKLNFTEDVIKLYSEVSTNNNIKKVFKKYDDFPHHQILEDEGFLFKVFEIKSLDVQIPDYLYGLEFKSKEVDSLARFHNLYFRELNSLTNYERKLVAINAHSRYRDENQRDSLLLSLNEVYGSPFVEMKVSDSYDLNSHTWIANDKIIEVTTSFGHSFEINTAGKSENYKFYKLDLLIVDNSELKSLVRAHKHYFDDMFLAN